MSDSRQGVSSLHMPRSRGAVGGLLLIILGAWGALVPFVGPYFHFAYPPGQVWVWTTARAWLEVFPGALAALGGLLLLISGHRVTAMFGGWLAVIAGAWFVVGRTLAPALRLDQIGQPLAATDAKRAVIDIASFSGLGALIVFVGGAVLARVTSRTARDVQWEQQSHLPAAADPETDDAFAESARTEELPPVARSQQNKRGIFRRAPSH
jgi:hypothetical protein